MKAYQYFNEHGQIITQIFHEPGEMKHHTSDNGSNSIDLDHELETMHKKFKHFRLCTDGFWRDPKQCVEKKRAR